MNQCQACRHWRVDEWDRPESIELPAPEFKLCHAIGGGMEEERAPGQITYVHVSDRYYSGDLWTAPEFGCVLWEAKP